MSAIARSILMFDSGAGGLSIAKKVCTDPRLKKCSLHYLADNACFPYGKQADETVIERTAFLISEYLKSSSSIDIIVIACNTASTLALPSLRKQFDLPIVGVVPAIKPAAQLSQSKHIGVVATEATVSRAYTKDLIQEHAGDCVAFLHPSQSLVEAAESFVLGDKHTATNEIQNIVDNEVASLINLDADKQIDLVVLACTHFPLLIDFFERSRLALKHGLRFVDSGDAIVNRIVSLLQDSAQRTELESNQRTSEERFVTVITESKSMKEKLELAYRHFLETH